MTALTRREGWQERLTAEIKRSRNKEFSAWTNNCGLFVARCIYATTGISLDWHSWRGSVRASAEALKLPEIPPLQARRGDIVEVDGALGICCGEHCAVMGVDGVVHVSLERASAAWRIG